MGYTHHFSKSRAVSKKCWTEFTREVRSILAHPAIAGLVCEESDQPKTPPMISSTEVRFNGKGEQGHETFVLTRAAHREFCKTGGLSQMNYTSSWGKHYDVAVCCVLLSAKHHLGESVASDGDWSDEGWMRARVLYALITSRIIKCPWCQKTCSKCGRVFKRDGHAWGGSEVCSKCGGGSYHQEGNIRTCMGCNAKNSFRLAKPTNWCWYCSNGFKDKNEAAASIEKHWAALTKTLENMADKETRP